MYSSPLIIIADTDVLINFLNIKRLDLIGQHSHDYEITDHVREEVTEDFPEQKRLLEQAIKDGILKERELCAIEELELFSRFTQLGRLGYGECSAISCAIHGGHKLAIEDRRATREALRVSAGIEILKTQDILVSMIHENLLCLEEADEIKEMWENDHRFKLKFSSFSELIN